MPHFYLGSFRMSTTNYYSNIWPAVVAQVYDNGQAFCEALPVEDWVASSEWKLCTYCNGSGCDDCGYRGGYGVVRFKPQIVRYEAGRVLSREEALTIRGVALRNVRLTDV